jgi:hypothetical protein
MSANDPKRTWRVQRKKSDYDPEQSWDRAPHMSALGEESDMRFAGLMKVNANEKFYSALIS